MTDTPRDPAGRYDISLSVSDILQHVMEYYHRSAPEMLLPRCQIVLARQMLEILNVIPVYFM